MTFKDFDFFFENYIFCSFQERAWSNAACFPLSWNMHSEWHFVFLMECLNAFLTIFSIFKDYRMIIKLLYKTVPFIFHSCVSRDRFHCSQFSLTFLYPDKYTFDLWKNVSFLCIFFTPLYRCARRSAVLLTFIIQISVKSCSSLFLASYYLQTKSWLSTDFSNIIMLLIRLTSSK